MTETPSILLQNALANLTSDSLLVFQISQKEETPYFAAVGRFIVEYAQAEAAIHLVARSLSGLPDRKARALFSGMRLNDIKERIHSMMRIDDIERAKRDDITNCIEHLENMGEQRHALVHRMVTYKASSIHISNSMLAKSLDHIEKHTLTITDLDNMAWDCFRIFSRLLRSCPQIGIDPPSEEVREWLYKPWLYIPALPSAKRKPHPQARKSKLPQPQPSQV